MTGNKIYTIISYLTALALIGIGGCYQYILPNGALGVEDGRFKTLQGFETLIALVTDVCWGDRNVLPEGTCFNWDCWLLPIFRT